MNTLLAQAHLRRLWRPVFRLAGLLTVWFLMYPTVPRAQEMAQEWEVYTKDGVERKPRSQPLQVDIGQPEVVEVPSTVTGTGQGKRLENVEVVVSKGPGGTASSGVVDNRIFAMAEDKEGRIWFATQGGLSRFDGQSWTNFTTDTELEGVLVTDVVVDQKDQLWVSEQSDPSRSGGVSRFDGQTWTNYRFLEGGSRLAVAPNGDIWLAGGSYFDKEKNNFTGVLYRFDGGSWWRYSVKDGIPFPGGISFVTVDPKGTVWAVIAGAEGPFAPYELTSFDGRQWTSCNIPTGSSFASVTSAIADSRNRLWIEADDNLFVLDDQVWYKYERKGWANGGVLFEETADKLWLSGIDGFGFLSGNVWHYFPLEGSEGIFSSVLVDHDGDLWVGSASGKLIKCPQASIPTNIEMPTNPPNPKSLNLFPNYPNPFNQETQITFHLPQRENLELKVLNPTGRTVTTLLDGVYAAGVYQTSWDGRDKRGQVVASGIYLYQLATGKGQITHKMLLLK